MIRLLRRIRLWRGDDSGNATVEFTLMAPFFFMLLLMGTESGITMTRQMLMERALDIAVRDLRLGNLGDPVTGPTIGDIRDRICENSVMLPDCQNNLLLDLQEVSTAIWDFPATPPACIDRANNIAPLTSIVPGGSNDMMLIRSCMIIDPLFPTTRWGLGLPLDASGGYQMFSLSAFVNEPR